MQKASSSPLADTRYRHEAVTIVAIYAVVGTIWIYGSDTLLGWIIRDPDVLVTAAVAKGTLFIMFTAALLYFLIHRFFTHIAGAERKQLESLKSYQVIFNATNEAIILAHPNTGKILDVNDQMLAMYGFTKEEALQADLEQLSAGTHLYTQFATIESLRNAIKEGPQVFEWLSRKKSGDLFWTEISCKLVILEELAKIIVVIRDITERKQAENLMREREQFLQSVLQTSADGFFVLDDQGRLTEINDAFCAMTGFAKSELIGKHIDSLESTAQQIEHHSHITKSIHDGARLFESALQHHNGTLVPVEISATDLTGKTAKMICFCRNLTERKIVEKKLHSTLAKTQVILSSIQPGMLLISNENKVEFINQSFCDLFSLLEDPASLIGLSASEIIAKFRNVFDHPDQALARIRAILQDDRPIRNEEITIKGERTYLRDYIPFMIDGVKYGRLWHHVDVTEQKLAAQRLQESEERFRMLHNASFGGIAIHDKGLILECNQGLAEISGFTTEELIGMDGLLLIAPSARQLVMHHILSGYEKPYEAVGIRKNGEEYPLRLEARTIPYRGKKVRSVEFRDITEYKQYEAEHELLQKQLIQAQKMESIGRLAGGVAHDFNNMLGIILGYTELILEQIDDQQPYYFALNEIQQAARRSTELTRQLLAFARKQTVAPKVVNLNSIIQNTLTLLRRLIGEDIELEWLPAPDLGVTRIDPSQIDQILTNLCVNARDAIGNTGKVIIETHNRSFDEDYCAVHHDAAPGDYIMLAVSDTGCGMSPEIMSNLFEPFFTTKEMGKGTGLGLAMIYGVVKQNRGFLNVYSEPGKGSTFRVYLPRLNDEQQQFVRQPSDNPVAHGLETILLVEDEAMILTMAAAMLERLGYMVLPAGTPSKAIQIVREYSDTIHLLITDVIMPEMNGRELVKQVVQFQPDLKCLFMSGYTANVIAQHGVLEEGVNFIQKPFSHRELAAKVREVLDT